MIRLVKEILTMTTGGFKESKIKGGGPHRAESLEPQSSPTGPRVLIRSLLRLPIVSLFVFGRTRQNAPQKSDLIFLKYI